MNLTSNPVKQIVGDVICPGDKSISQRILIIGSLLNCDIKITGFLNAQDPLSTLAALNQIGAVINNDGDLVEIKKRLGPFNSSESSIDLGNSGTGIRLLTGFISGLNLKATLIGDESLSQRPMSRVVDPLVKMGKKILTNDGKTPIKIIGGSINDNFKFLMPVASAQVKSSLILASLSSGNSIQIREPKVTRDHTEKMIQYLNGEIDVKTSSEGKIITLHKSKLSKISSYEVVGDFSSAAFIIVATLISKDSRILIKNVGLNETRIGLIEVLSKMNADIKIINKRVICNEICGDLLVKSSNLVGIEVSDHIVPNIIDEIPILSIAACFAKGKTIIKNASELKVKESDRLNATSIGLTAMKINHELLEDGLIIEGTEEDIVVQEEIDSYGDHRIAMSFLVAGIRSKYGINVKNCDNINTSFPDFCNTMNSLNMRIHEKN